MSVPTTTYRRRATKHQWLCEELSGLANRLGPGEKLPTVLQLCEQFDVSVITLNNALKELEAQRLISRRHGVGIFAAERLRSVCLICDPYLFSNVGASPVWQMLIDQAQLRATERGEKLSLHFAVRTKDASESPVQEGLAAEIRNGQVHGILGIGLLWSGAQWLAAQQIPFVTFASNFACSVGTDNARFIHMAVDELVRQGCRRIELWGPVTPFRPAIGASLAFRPGVLETFQAALAENELRFESERIRDNRDLAPDRGDQTTMSQSEQGQRTTLAAFGPDAAIEPPDGIVSMDDMMTHGVLMSLQRQSIRVGEDVKIVSHANHGSPVLYGWEEKLMILEYDPADYVRAMFQLLETMMEGGASPTTRIEITPRWKSPPPKIAP